MIFSKSLKIINNTNRVSSIDVYRGIAILAVVFYHFNTYLPFGYLGVDLFFVISGLLIGGLLIHELDTSKTKYWRFIIRRSFKIWPSYFFFIFCGSLVAILLYSNTHPEYIITLETLPRYLFFYRNFTGVPHHWPFDHLWSICVEEHFYFILPILFIIAGCISTISLRSKFLFFIIIFTISLGISAKYIAFYFTNSQDTYSATYNRIDALSWGVLLSILIKWHTDAIKAARIGKVVCLGLGFSIFIFAIGFHMVGNSLFFNKVVFPSIIPMSFMLIILATYFQDFRKWRTLRIIAYYSYNWYLWHALFITFIYEQIGNNLLGLVVYLFSTFFVAVISTSLIEEPLLKIRANYVP